MALICFQGGVTTVGLFRILFLLVPLVLCTPSAARGESGEGMKIGVSLVLSGPWASWGTPIRDGLELGAEDTKNRISFEFQDDRCEAKSSLTIFQRFLALQKMPILVLGCMESIEAVQPQAERRGAVVFTMGGMSREYLHRFPHLIGLYSLVDSEAYFLVPYLRDTARIKTVAIINHSATYGEYLGRGFESLAKRAGLQVVTRESVDHDLSDFRSVVVRINRLRPEAVFIHISAEKEGLLIKQLRELGYTGAIFGSFTTEASDVITAAGAAMTGVRITSPVVDSSRAKELESFRQRYLSRFKREPEPTSAIAYDAAQIIDGAITQCGRSERSCLASYVTTLGNFHGLGGEVIFGRDRSAIRPYGLKEYRNGRFEWIESRLPAFDEQLFR